PAAVRARRLLRPEGAGLGSVGSGSPRELPAGRAEAAGGIRGDPTGGGPGRPEPAPAGATGRGDDDRPRPRGPGPPRRRRRRRRGRARRGHEAPALRRPARDPAGSRRDRGRRGTGRWGEGAGRPRRRGPDTGFRPDRPEGGGSGVGAVAGRRLVTGQGGVLLVCMPFGHVFAPSIGLSLLKAGLAAQDIPARVRYYSIPFAERIAQHFYSGFPAQSRPPLEDLAGEWIFSSALFGAEAANEEEEYVEKILRGRARRPSLIERIRRARAEAGPF